MISAEREKGFEAPVFYKNLRLLLPEAANEFGVISESPVFVSPLISGRSNCNECGLSFEPLVYGCYAQVEAHHFHAGTELPFNGSGGIYFSKGDPREDLFSAHVFTYGFTGWIAIIEPPDEIYSSKSQPYVFESPKVRIKGIFAFCQNHDDQEQIDSGIVVSTERDLFPICKDVDSELKRRYDFKIEEGQVLFSQI